MIVNRASFPNVVASLCAPGLYAVDTETTGLRTYQGDRLFSLIIADETRAYYFNFQKYPDLSPDWVLPRSFLAKLQSVFNTEASVFAMHNAKFDLGMLAADGLTVHGTVHCTEAAGRLVQNDLFDYTLKALAKGIGLTKDDAVDEYIAKHKLFTERNPSGGKKKKSKQPHFEKVPFKVITEYGENDALITRALATHQLQAIAELDKSRPGNIPALSGVLENERRLTKTCFAMEQVGIKVNRGYCVRAMNHEVGRYREAMRKFLELTGVEFVDSNKVLAEAFTKLGEKYPTTAKGNPSFTDDVLEGFTSPVAKLVQTYRDAYKRAHTYYQNFIDFADEHDVLHANIRQAGTTTGRFSYSEPNLQNLSKEENAQEEYLIRRAFVPRDGFCFVMIDYEQMEYRLMLEAARELKVIAAILGGLDVHEATAREMGVSRYHAKTINFMLLYGGGAQKLATALKVTLGEAQRMREEYFQKLPRIRSWIRGITDAIQGRGDGAKGYLYNWFGRRYTIDKEFAYKGPNAYIQGGCADIVKLAMSQLEDFLGRMNAKSRMLVQIHDEILFEIHKDELALVPSLKRIMEQVFPARLLPMACSVDHSWVSWADKVKGLPVVSRNEIQEQDIALAQGAPEYGSV